MLKGLLSGIFWALDTVIIGLALVGVENLSKNSSVILFPIITAFIHDAFSSCFMIVLIIIKKEFFNLTKV